MVLHLISREAFMVRSWDHRASLYREVIIIIICSSGEQEYVSIYGLAIAIDALHVTSNYYVHG